MSDTLRVSNIYAGTAIGIGKNPAYALDVVGSINLTGSILVGGSTFSTSQWTTTGSNIYYNTGNVGIGTNAPLYDLSLVKTNLSATTGTNIAATHMVAAAQGSGGVYSGHFGGYLEGGCNFGQNTYMALGYVNTPVSTVTKNEMMRITDSGRIGIGITNPSYLFDVNGNLNIRGSLLVNGTAVATGTGSIWTANGTSAYYTTGNVGIGITNPQGAFHISSTSTNSVPFILGFAGETYSLTSSTKNQYMTAGTLATFYTSATNTNNGCLIDFNAYNSTNGATGTFLGSVAGPTGNGPANFVIGRRTNVFSWAESLRIDTTGNVGIGTNAPSGKLTVQPTSVTVGIGSTAYCGIHIQPVDNSNTTADQYTGITWSGTGSGNYGTHAGILVQGSGAYGTKMYFQTTNGWGLGTQSRMMIDHSGNVGIGTTLPSNLLHVNGAINCTNLLVNGTAVATGTGSVWTAGTGGLISYGGGTVNVHKGTFAPPSMGLNGGSGDRLVLWPGDTTYYPYSFGIDASTLWASSPGHQKWYIGGGTMGMMLNSSAYLGIGTGPSAPLHVYGSTSVYGSNGTVQITNTNTNPSGCLTITAPNMTASTGIELSFGQSATSYNMAWIQFNYVAAGSTANYTEFSHWGTGNHPLAITAGGLVGVGITNPAQQLHINGDGARLRIESTTANNSVLELKTVGNISYLFTDQSGHLEIYPYTTSKYILMQPTGGNVGIGNYTPNAYLCVGPNGGVNGSGNIPGISMKSVSGSYAHYSVGQDDTHNAFFCWVYDATVANGYGRIQTYSGNNPICIQDGGGNVGIGTNAPAYKLDVFSGTARLLQAQLNGVQTIHLGPITDNSYDLGWSGARWKTVWSINGTVQTSDSNFKDAKPLSYGLAEVLQMRTIQYKWKSQANLPDSDPEKNYEYYGFCADELAPLFPELVYDEKKDEPIQMNYSEIMPVMVNAIKELHAKVEKQDALIASQSELIQKQAAMLEALAAKLGGL